MFDLLTPEVKRRLFKMAWERGYVNVFIIGAAPRHQLRVTWPGGSEENLLNQWDNPEQFAAIVVQAQAFARHIEDRLYQMVIGDSA
jgi:hypothetical protein